MSSCKDGKEYFLFYVKQRVRSKPVNRFVILFLRVNIPSVSFHASGISPFHQATFKSLHSRLRRSVNIFYTLLWMAFGLGAEQVLAFLTTLLTSHRVGSFMSSFVPNSYEESIRSQSHRTISLLESEWVE